MIIAISINTAWNIYNFRLGLVKALLSKGHEVIAVAPTDEYAAQLIEIGCAFEPVSIDNTGANPLKDIALIYRYHKIFKRRRPDIVLQFTIKPNIYGTFAAKALGIPVINNVSGLGTVFLNKGVVSNIAHSLYRASFRKVDLTFFQNEEDEKDFKSTLGLEDLHSDQLPGSGIDLIRFSPVNREPDGDKFVFLMISRLIIDKGVNEYVEAARQLKAEHHNLKCILIGKIDNEHKRSIADVDLKQWIGNDWIEYLPETPEIEDIISKADCVVLPSYREGTPRTLLEAAAMGKPLIATDVPGCRNVINEGVNGFLCQAKDPQSLFTAMAKILTLNHKERNEMGVGSRLLAEEKFDENIVIDKYLHWISEIGSSSKNV